VGGGRSVLPRSSIGGWIGGWVGVWTGRVERALDGGVGERDLHAHSSSPPTALSLFQSTPAAGFITRIHSFIHSACSSVAE